MTEFTGHSCSYQGLVGGAAAYRRSDGFQPDVGWIDLDLEELGDVDIFTTDVPWRPAGGRGFETPKQISIHAWQKLRRPTIAEEAYLAPIARPRRGLNEFGDLVFLSQSGGRVHKGSPMRYQDIYVADSGIEEITEGIADGRAHKRGTVRVPLTDIRSLYRDRGAFVGRINVRLRNGEYDRDSVQENGQAWPIAQAVRFLFSQLPGSPLLHSKSELFQLSGDDARQPAPEIVGEGEPTVQVLEKLLDELGLVPQLLPNNHYAVKRRLSTGTVYGWYPQRPNRLVQVKDVHEERKTIRVSRRPELVQVFGKPVVQRFIHTYVPGFRHAGRWYKLQDVAAVLSGTTIADVNQGVFAGDNAFSGAKPSLKSDPALHDYNRQVLRKHAYRTYIPAFLFDLPIAKGVSSRVSSFSEEDLARAPFLPFVDTPLYKSDLARIRTTLPTASRKVEADSEDILLTGPIVWANTVGPGRVEDIKAIRSRVSGLSRNLQRAIAAFRIRINEIDTRIRQIGRDFQRIQLTVKKANSKGLIDKYQEFMLSRRGIKVRFGSKVGVFIDVNADVATALQRVGTPLQVGKLVEEEMNTTHWVALNSKIPALERERKELLARIAEELSKLHGWDKITAKLESVYREWDGIQLAQTNVPYGPVPDGAYSLDRKTGIITFGDPACHMVHPFVISGEVAVVASGGSVQVLAASEKFENVTGRITSVLVSSKGGATEEDPINLSLVGVCKSSPLPAATERHPDMRLYIDEFGNPMNQGAVISAGFAKAFGQLAQPRKVTGWTYTMDGFLDAWLDGGVNAIEHSWQGKDVAYTTIAVNNPGGRSPIGIPRFKPAISTVDYRYRLSIESSGVN